MLENFINYFFLFVIYSFLGWLIEVIRTFFIQKKFVNRGFLIGPYCPIYGFGCVMITLFLKNNVEDVATVFLKSILICSVLEYFTSYIMEKVFKYRWWDYSKRKFNINGRICLETMIPFGVGACIIIYFINPILLNFINRISSPISTFLFIILLISIIVDFSISIVLIIELKGIQKNSKIDSTEAIGIKIKEMMKSKAFYRRIFESFPNLQKIKSKTK